MIQALKSSCHKKKRTIEYLQPFTEETADTAVLGDSKSCASAAGRNLILIHFGKVEWKAAGRASKAIFQEHYCQCFIQAEYKSGTRHSCGDRHAKTTLTEREQGSDIFTLFRVVGVYLMALSACIPIHGRGLRWPKASPSQLASYIALISQKCLPRSMKHRVECIRWKK